jgi:hypothetical protein
VQKENIYMEDESIMDMSSEGYWEDNYNSVDGACETTSDATDDTQQPIELYISFCFDDVNSTEILTGDIILNNIPNGATLNLGEAGSDYTWIISQDHLLVTETNDAGNAVGWEIPGLTMKPNDQRANFYMLVMQVTVLDGDQIKAFANLIKVST